MLLSWWIPIPNSNPTILWFCFRHFHRKQSGFRRWEASGARLLKHSSHLFWNFCCEQNDFMFSWFLFGTIIESPPPFFNFDFWFKLLVCIVFIFKTNQLTIRIIFKKQIIKWSGFSVDITDFLECYFPSGMALICYWVIR